MSLFENFSNELNSHKIGLQAAELHGMIVGYVCGAKKDVSDSSRHLIYENWLGVEPSLTIVNLFESFYSAAEENLDEFADFEFRLLLPPDEVAIGERVAAVATWCSGFLSGLSESGRRIDRLEGDAAEALADLNKISAMTSSVVEGEENEADLTEIEEFIRVSVLVIFAEINARGSR